jgi:4-hydroxy-tetrahydrodipicolinate synthase
VERVNQLCAALAPLELGLQHGFEILSGDDSLTLPFLAAGAVGVISVASNIIPAEVQDLVQSYRNGNFSRAQSLHQRFYPLFRDLFIETNPVPVKTALAVKKGYSEDVRLPLCEMGSANRDVLLKTLHSTGILELQSI